LAGLLGELVGDSLGWVAICLSWVAGGLVGLGWLGGPPGPESNKCFLLEIQTLNAFVLLVSGGCPSFVIQQLEQEHVYGFYMFWVK
jgi:hypothetical protein